MSLNGDIHVMRNGRSTSQISIYNYPEHLNPFYEDDQHKRLRFWKLNKKNDGSGERRNSFSIGGLKDMWAFKSFRLKKKSSTLGINKTSESPPPLRRDLYYTDAGYNSFDHRLRHSSNDNVNNYDNFQRNAIYRSSLQNVNAAKQTSNGAGFGFQRNDQYRNTIQYGGGNGVAGVGTGSRSLIVPNHNRRYVYGGSVTPQPVRNTDFNRGNNRDNISRGSSQTSVNTNPFETDNEDDNEDFAQSRCSSSLSMNRTPRKKRRAPAPPVPVPVHKINVDPNSNNLTQSSHNNSQQQNELHIEENLEILNLTAEIENFVKTTTSEVSEDSGIETTPKKIEHTKPQTIKTEIQKTNGAIPKESTVTTITTTTTTTTKSNNLTKETPKHAASNVEIITKSNLTNHINQRQQQPETEIGHIECIHVHVDSPRSTPIREVGEEENRVSSFKTQPKPIIKTIKSDTAFILTSPPVKRREIKIVEDIVDDDLQILEKPHSKPHIEPKPAALVVKAKASKVAEIYRPSRGPPPSSNDVLQIRQQHQINEKIVDIVEQEKVSPKVEIVKQQIEQEKVPQNVELIKQQVQQVKIPQKVELIEQQVEQEKVSPKGELIKQQVEQEKVTPTVELNKQQVEKEGAIKVESTTKAPLAPVRNINETTKQIVEITDTKQTNTEIDATPTTSKSDLQIREAITTTTTTTTAKVNGQPTIKTEITTKRNPTNKVEFDASIFRPKPTSYMEWKQSTLAPLPANVPPEKRKSVKDIIESINRSQRLLNSAANKEQLSITSPVITSQTLELDNNSRKNSISSINFDLPQTKENDVLNNRNPAQTNNTDDATKLDNGEIFKKGQIKKDVYDYRETSPTTSNLDWNPVPKPRRSRNASDS